ncbi:MAG: cyclic nucleotide-binding domain-containing protein [Planctomycetaceae bacterium]
MTAPEPDLPAGPIFDSLTAPQRRELLALMETASFEPGTSIVDEGKQTPGLWILTRGRCDVVKATPDGDRVLAELGPGTVFGEMSFFERVPHAATVRSVTSVTALRLTPENYAQLERTGLRAAHQIAHAIAVVLSERLRQMDEWTTCLLTQSRPEKREEWAEFRAKLYNGWGI